MTDTSFLFDILAKVTRGELENAYARVTADVEQELYYYQAIQLSGGEQTKAAKWLGVSRPTMRERLVRYGLHPKTERTTAALA